MKHPISLAAALALSAATAADVVYSDRFEMLPAACGHTVVQYDLDGDGVGDFCFALPCCDCPSGCSSAWMAIDATAGVTQIVIDAGEAIEQDSPWTDSVVWYFDAGGCYEGVGCYCYKGSCVPSPTYIGLKFPIAGEVHYGWLRVFEGWLLDYAYETAPATPIAAGDGLPPLGDLDRDGVVGAADLAILLGDWTGGAGYRPCPPVRPADLDEDCAVDGADLAILLANWTL